MHSRIHPDVANFIPKVSISRPNAFSILDHPYVVREARDSSEWHALLSKDLSELLWGNLSVLLDVASIVPYTELIPFYPRIWELTLIEGQGNGDYLLVSILSQH